MEEAAAQGECLGWQDILLTTTSRRELPFSRSIMKHNHNSYSECHLCLIWSTHFNWTFLTLYCSFPSQNTASASNSYNTLKFLVKKIWKWSHHPVGFQMKPDTLTCQAAQENILMHNLWHDWISSEILIQTEASARKKLQKKLNFSTIPLSTLNPSAAFERTLPPKQ